MRLTRCISLIFLAFCSQNVTAQLTDGSIAPNFTLTDVNGDTYELYDYLDQGKSVLLDFFAVWCSPCQAHAPTLDDAYQAYGPNGNNSMMFFALESDDATSNAQCNNYGGFQWSSVISYPIINATGNVPNQYAINYYPTVYVVCPDRVITEIGQVSANAIGAFVDANCESIVSENDLQVNGLSVNMDNCVASASPVAEIKNVGSNSIFYPQIELYVDDVLVESINWSAFINPLQTVNIEFSSLSNLSPGLHNMEVILESDDNTGNNILSAEFNVNQFPTDVINLNLVLDNYPTETSWELLDESGLVLYNGSGYSVANGTIEESLHLASEACYTFSIYDSYGDGICCSYGSGSYNLSAYGVEITGGDFGSSESFNFYVGELGAVVSQVIDFPMGWSMFSSYMQAENMDLIVLLNEIQLQVVIAKDYLGSAYLPDWDYNGIGDVQYNQGYQIKTSEACSITIEGDYVVPEDNALNLEAGWNIISYLRLESAPADLVFNDLILQWNIVIAKDASGAAYLPDWDYNGIGNLEPGKGYHLKTYFAGELIYLSNSLQYE